MEISELAWRLLFIFVPGLITILVVRHLSIHKEFTSFYFIIYSFLAGIINFFLAEVIIYLKDYLSYQLKLNLCPHILHVYTRNSLQIWEALFNNKQNIPLDEVSLISLLAIFTGLFGSAGIQHKWLIRFSRKFGITKRFGDDDVWSLFLNSKTTEWVYIRNRKNGLTYFGKIRAFSEPDKAREILIEEVEVYFTDSGEKLYKIPAVYLSNTANELEIELADASVGTGS